MINALLHIDTNTSRQNHSEQFSFSTNRLSRFVCVFLTMLFIPVMADSIVHNCPKHGPCTEYQVEKKNGFVLCRRCQEEKKRDEESRPANGPLNETDIKENMVINSRSFGSIEGFSKRCLSSITDRYVKIGGSIVEKKVFRFKVLQRVGVRQYIVTTPEKTFKANLLADGYVDEQTIQVVGFHTQEVYEYTTVMGANRRVGVFQEVETEPILSEDIKAYLASGKEFVINLTHKTKPYEELQGASYTRFGAAYGGTRVTKTEKTDLVTISLKRGVIVKFENASETSRQPNRY